MRVKVPPRAWAIVGAITLAIVLVRLAPGTARMDAIFERASGSGTAGMALFVLLYVLSAVLFLPGSLLTLAAGAVYGPALATALVSLGSTLGAAAAFLVGRFLARERVCRWARAHPRFASIDAAVGREGGRIVFLARLSPLFPYNLLNYLFGVSGVRFGPYLAATWIGMLPATFLYAYLGSAGRQAARAAAGDAVTDGARLALWGTGLAATALLTILLARLARRALEERTR